MESNDKEPTFEFYTGDLLNFMRYCQIWKPDTFSRKKNVLVVLTVCTLLSSDILIIIATLIDFKNASNDLTSFAAYVGPLCLQCIGLMKWSYCIFKVKDISRLVESLKWCHSLSMKINKNDLGWTKYKREMETTRLYYVRFIYGWLWLCMYGILHWCSNSIILEIHEEGFTKGTLTSDDNSTNTRIRYLPYLGWRPWDVNENNLGYIILFLIQFIGGLGSAIGSITYDVFYISSLMIICAHLRYLNHSLTDVGSNDRCTRFLDALEILASPAMFVQCIENIIVLCLISLEASTVEVNTNLKTVIKLWSMLEYFLSIIVQLFVYCYYATEIRILGLQIADSVYMSNWENITFNNLDIDEKADTRRIHFLVRSQRAILLTGGPFYILSLETFKSVVGIAMSNSVILRQVVEERA